MFLPPTLLTAATEHSRKHILKVHPATTHLITPRHSTHPHSTTSHLRSTHLCHRICHTGTTHLPTHSRHLLPATEHSHRSSGIAGSWRRLSTELTLWRNLRCRTLITTGRHRLTLRHLTGWTTGTKLRRRSALPTTSLRRRLSCRQSRTTTKHASRNHSRSTGKQATATLRRLLLIGPHAL
jgi:hypothetical protein